MTREVQPTVSQVIPCVKENLCQVDDYNHMRQYLKSSLLLEVYMLLLCLTFERVFMSLCQQY